MRVTANLLTEAEEIARKDGHRVEDWNTWARRVRPANRRLDVTICHFHHTHTSLPRAGTTGD